MSSPEDSFDEAMLVADQAREQILALLETVSQEDSEQKVAPESWSLGEIAHHLILAEGRFTEQLLEAISAGKLEEYSRTDVLAQRHVALEDTADAEKSGRGKAPPWSQPTHGLPIQDLIQDLRQAREETRTRLSPHRTRALEKLWWRHPRYGPMDLYEKIRLYGYHDQKHLSQMKNYLAKIRG